MRFSLPLAVRIFLISALLVTLSIGAAVGVTYLIGNRSAETAIRGSLETSQSIQAEMRERRFDQLELISQVFSNDTPFTSYIIEASGGGLEGEGIVDRGSMLDILGERQQSMGFEFAVILDPEGRVLVRTDRPGDFGSDLSSMPLVEAVLTASHRQAGFWLENDRLYQAAVVPILSPNFDLYGLLVTGFAVDDALASEIKRISGSDVNFVLTRADGSLQIPATTLDAALADRLRQRLQSDGILGPVLERGEEVTRYEVELDDRYRASAVPLVDSTGEIAGATVSLFSVDAELSGYRAMQRAILIAGGLSLLIALVLSYTLSRRTLKPVKQLVTAAEAAAQGDYSRSIPEGGGGEVSQLARAFNSLLGDLREKTEIEAYVSDLSRYLPDPDVSEALVAPSTRTVALLAVELRRFARLRSQDNPEATIESVTRDLRRVASAIAARHGNIEALCGHRVLARFEGLGASLNAVAAAGQLVRHLRGDDAFEAEDPPAIAVAQGEIVYGSVVWGENPKQALVGSVVLQLDMLLREAAPGDILLARSVHEELQESFERSGIELRATQGALSTQPLFVLDAAVAERLAGLATTSLTVAPTSGTGSVQMTLSGIGPGSVLGNRFELLSVLGSGGMGVVYKAKDRELDDLVALKTLKREAFADSEGLERLKIELKLARRITHPNVLRTYDFGDLAGIAFISMEYVRGLTLRYLLEQTGRLPLSAGLRLARQLCAGLQAAHQEGVLHRDIKPENLIIDNAGNAKLMDFGIARPIKRSKAGQTEPGSLVGTPHYLAPEQLQGEDPDQRADIYACGMVFYEMFTGKLPFSGKTPMQIILAHINEEPMPPSAHWPEIPQELERLLMQCLEKRPEERIANVGVLLKRIQTVAA